MDAQKPLVTVCVSYYNDEKYIKNCIDSILVQSLPDFELILFNHASTDASYQIAHSYQDKRIIHIDAPKNLGAGATQNFHYILPHLHGKYYKAFCADDVMEKDCLTKLSAFSKENPDKDIVFGNMTYIDAAGRSLGENWFHHFKGFNVNATEIDLLKMFSEGRNNLPLPASFVKSDILKEIKVDESLTIRADMWLWASALINGAKVGFTDEIVAYYRRHEYQESYFDMEIISRRSEYEKIPFLSLFYNLKDINTAQQIFSDSPYKEQLKDKADIPFYVAEYYMRRYGYSFAYHDLFKMLLDDRQRVHLEKIFGFGVLELRKLYAFKQTNQSFKQRIYAKQPKKLTVLELLYLLAKKILNKIISLVTLRFLRRKKI